MIDFHLINNIIVFLSGLTQSQLALMRSIPAIPNELFEKKNDP